MLQPIAIFLTNFKGIQNLDFTFPTEPGLYFVTGQNEDNLRLEGNACGKSTLFCDSIAWCLYGKTPRGLRASDIINWSATTCKGEFHFSVGTNQYKVRRQQNPNSLTCSVNGGRFDVMVQGDLNTLVGLDYDAFCYSVIFAQFGRMFFDLTPTEKSSLMESVLPLDVWESASSLAKKKSESLSNDVQELQQQVMESKGRLSALEGLIIQSDAKMATWADELADEIKEVESSIAQLDHQLTTYKDKGKQLREKETELEASNVEAAEVVDYLCESHASLTSKMTVLNAKSNRFSDEVVSLRQEITRLSKLGDICAVCKQVIDGKHVHSEQDKHKQRILDIGDALVALKEEAVALQTQLKLSGEEVNEAKTVAESLKRQLYTLGGELNGIKQRVLGVLDSKKTFMRNLEMLKVKKNPFIEQKQGLEKEKGVLTRKIVQIRGEINTKQALLANTQYWVSGFKEVKLMLINDILAQLEIEVNNNLYQLGLVGWKIEFASEFVNKSGKSKKSFTVMIHSPETEKPVPWEAWSGGETQRLRLAGALGMADLILMCFGASQGFEVYDEPSQYLSSSGITDLVASLRDRALTTGRVIFLVDHRNLDATKFAGMYTVVRNSGKVQVIVE